MPETVIYKKNTYLWFVFEQVWYTNRIFSTRKLGFRYSTSSRYSKPFSCLAANEHQRLQVNVWWTSDERRLNFVVGAYLQTAFKRCKLQTCVRTKQIVYERLSIGKATVFPAIHGGTNRGYTAVHTADVWTGGKAIDWQLFHIIDTECIR